jgi:DNA-binding transcriptional MerR regulator
MGSLIPIWQVAERYDVTERTVRNWISQGLIIGYKRNNQAIYIDERSLDNIFTPIKRVK